MVALPVIGRDDALAAIAAGRGARGSLLLLGSDLGKVTIAAASPLAHLSLTLGYVGAAWSRRARIGASAAGSAFPWLA
jgi:hypothetical protein